MLQCRHNILTGVHAVRQGAPAAVTAYFESRHGFPTWCFIWELGSRDRRCSTGLTDVRYGPDSPWTHMPQPGQSFRSCIQLKKAARIFASHHAPSHLHVHDNESRRYWQLTWANISADALPAKMGNLLDRKEMRTADLRHSRGEESTGLRDALIIDR